MVNWGALPSATGAGRYLIEDARAFHVLSTERAVTRWAVPGGAGAGLLAVGAPAFGTARRPAASQSRATMTRGCADFGGVQFTPLPGSAAEVHELAARWTAARGPGATILEGRHATEAAITAQAEGREIVHLASHAFAIAGRCFPAAERARLPHGAAMVRQADALLTLCGLACADANAGLHEGSGGADGILTAGEIAHLDLEGVRWMVLSACRTGVGTPLDGEGVFGLRRGVEIAGAGTLIMSLWSVDDAATREWMEALYIARLDEQRDTVDAWHTATRRVLASRRARGAATHPAFWGAFVAAGDWH